MYDRWSKVHLSLVKAASTSLTNREFMIYLVFDSHKNAENVAWPGRDLIAEILGCEPRSLERHVRGLIGKGWLTPLNKPHTGQRAEYRVNGPQVVLQNDVPSTERATTFCVKSYNILCKELQQNDVAEVDINRNKNYRAKKNRSTRNISLQENLKDTSWAYQ